MLNRDPMIVILTDLHLVPEGENLFGLCPRTRLEAAISAILRDHSHAACVLVMGDLTHRGEAEAYRVLAEVLEPLQMPVYLMLGNHDRRDAFHNVFSGNTDPNGFVQFTIPSAWGSLVCLDSLLDPPGPSHGTLCHRRLDWLSNAMPVEGPWVLALHHPPMAVGLPNMDRICLDAGDQLYEILAPNPPTMMLCGHVHRAITGVWRGIPFHIQRAIAHQVAWYPTQTPELMFVDEPPEFSILTSGPHGPILHTRAFASEGAAFPKQ